MEPNETKQKELELIRKDGTMSRADLSDNFTSHFSSKFKNVNASLRDVMNEYSPKGEDSRCDDALVETLSRKGIRMQKKGSLEATRVRDVLHAEGDAQILALEFLDACFYKDIGIDYTTEDARAFASGPSSRDRVDPPFNPPTYSQQIRNDFEPIIRLEDIIAERVTLTGNTYEPGIINDPQNLSTATKIPEGSEIPETTVTVSYTHLTLPTICSV